MSVERTTNWQGEKLGALGSAYFRLCFPASSFFLLFKAAIRFLSVRARERVQRALYKAEAASIPSSILHPSNNRINKHLYSALEKEEGDAMLPHSPTPIAAARRESSGLGLLDCQADAAIFSPLFPFVVKLLYSIRQRRRD